MTTETAKRMAAIAPYPTDHEEATAANVSRCLAATAQGLFARSLEITLPRPDATTLGRMVAEFATAHALIRFAEVDRDAADRAAAEIWDAWEDGGGVGEWLWEHLTAFGIDPAEVSEMAVTAAKASTTGNEETANA